MRRVLVFPKEDNSEKCLDFFIFYYTGATSWKLFAEDRLTCLECKRLTFSCWSVFIPHSGWCHLYLLPVVCFSQSRRSTHMCEKGFCISELFGCLLVSVLYTDNNSHEGSQAEEQLPALGTDGREGDPSQFPRVTARQLCIVCDPITAWICTFTSEAL